jgi:hypothetical protein
MPSPTGSIEFVAYHQPALLDGEYVLSVKQQVQIDGTNGWGTDANDLWRAAPSAQLQFSVAGPRFSLDPGLIQSQFPPPKSIGEYYNVLPHIIFNRTTLPWERTVDNSAPSDTEKPKSWMALLLFDKKADAGAPVVTDLTVPVVTDLTVKDLLDTYGQSATPAGNQPEFVRILKRGAQEKAGRGELMLEVGQHPNDRLTVIDVPKQLLWHILPSADEIGFLSHVRTGQSSQNPNTDAEYPVILCNRLPAPGVLSKGTPASGTGDDSPVGTESTVHLISLEARQPLLDALQTKPVDNHLVRFVSLASWSFSTLQRNKTFSGWLKDAWCPDKDRTDSNNLGKQASSCAAGVIHTLRMPASSDSDTDAERFLSQGYVPIRHQTRQGNHLVSWYRSPLLPGRSPGDIPALPVRMSDELVRYFSDVGMFDVTYAAAWELGRMLTLRSKKVSVSLYNWNRARAQQVRQNESPVGHLPFAPDYSIAPDSPALFSQWFDELVRLNHVPFHYLVPREEMLPANSLRFFQVDLNWLECLIDGAFSIGRDSSAQVGQDGWARKVGHVSDGTAYSGFLLRSPLVTGWPHLGVEAYTEVVPVGDDDYLPQGISPAQRLRLDRLGEDVLLCLFKGEIKTVDIHEHPETIHFGVDTGEDPSRIENYTKALRDKNSGKLGKSAKLNWKSSDKRTLNIIDLAAKGNALNSAEFGVTMIEGVEKVRFIKSGT